MEPLEATPLRVTVDELDIRIDTFKLVIRLSKAKQVAFRLRTILWSPAGPVVPWDPSEPAPSPKWDCSELQKLFLFHLRSFWSDIWTAKTGTCFPGVVFLSFDSFLVRLNISCTQFGGTWTAVYAIAARLDYGPEGE